MCCLNSHTVGRSRTQLPSLYYTVCTKIVSPLAFLWEAGTAGYRDSLMLQSALALVVPALHSALHSSLHLDVALGDATDFAVVEEEDGM